MDWFITLGFLVFCGGFFFFFFLVFGFFGKEFQKAKEYWKMEKHSNYANYSMLDKSLDYCTLSDNLII